jgi:hypothetical protein
MEMVCPVTYLVLSEARKTASPAERGRGDPCTSGPRGAGAASIESEGRDALISGAVLTPGARTYAPRMRDIDTIDSELRLVAGCAARSSAVETAGLVGRPGRAILIGTLTAVYHVVLQRNTCHPDRYR